MSQIQKKVKTKRTIKENMLPQQDPMMQQAPGMGMPGMDQEPSWDHPGCEDKIGKIFVVLKPQSGTSPEDLVHETHCFGCGQFEPQSVHGIYNDKEEANLVAEAATTDLHRHLNKIEKKKDHVLGKIDSHIAKLQKEINTHMKDATEVPELSEKHHELAERKMNIIKGLRDKHKAVKLTKKDIPENPAK